MEVTPLTYSSSYTGSASFSLDDTPSESILWAKRLISSIAKTNWAKINWGFPPLGRFKFPVRISLNKLGECLANLVSFITLQGTLLFNSWWLLSIGVMKPWHLNQTTQLDMYGLAAPCWKCHPANHPTRKVLNFRRKQTILMEQRKKVNKGQFSSKGAAEQNSRLL